MQRRAFLKGTECPYRASGSSKTETTSKIYIKLNCVLHMATRKRKQISRYYLQKYQHTSLQEVFFHYKQTYCSFKTTFQPHLHVWHICRLWINIKGKFISIFKIIHRYHTKLQKVKVKETFLLSMYFGSVYFWQLTVSREPRQACPSCCPK